MVTSAEVKLFLLGTPYIEVDGQLRRLQRQHSTGLALIAYLTVTKKLHSREYLRTLLWPDLSPDSSRFRVLLSRIRDAIPEISDRWLDNNYLELLPQERYWCDVVQFERLLRDCHECSHITREYCQFCLSRWKDMIRLYQGPFLDGIDMSESAEYDAWQRTQREKYIWDVSSTFSNIVDYCIAQHRYDMALTEAQYWIEHDRYNETAHYHIVNLLLHQGQQSAAKLHYETYEDTYWQAFAAAPTKTWDELLAVFEANDIPINRRPSTNTIISSSRVRIYRDSSQIKVPKHFCGRSAQQEQIDTALQESRRCLIQSMAGMGKTTLARKLAISRLNSNHEVIWIEFGENDATELLDELARVFDQKQFVGKSLPEKQDFMHRFLLHRKFAMILDDVWNEEALFEFLLAIPDSREVLVTSRLRISITGSVLVDLQELSSADALELLGYHGQQNYENDEGARRLCHILGGHPFSIEIAGRLLGKRKSLSPNHLASEIITKPHKTISSKRLVDHESTNFSELMSRSIDLLMEESSDLNEVKDSYSLFLLLGLLPTVKATVRLLSYIVDKSEDDIKQALWHLDELGLLDYYDDAHPPYYQFHKLTFSYSATLSSNPELSKKKILHGVEKFTEDFSSDYDVLSIEIENILGSVNKTDDSETLIRVVDILMVQGYFYSRGFNHTPALLKCADQAIEAARKHQPEYNAQLHYLLGKRGDASRSQKDYDEALAYYEESLSFAPNPNRKAILRSLIAVIYYRQDDLKASDDAFNLALQIAEDNRDKDALIRVLEYRGALAMEAGNFEKAYPLLLDALGLAREIADERRLFWILYNLSMTYVELDQTQDAFNTLREAQGMTMLETNILWQGFIYSGLARIYHNWGNRDQAQEYLNQAVTLYHDYGATEQVEWVRQFCEKEEYRFRLDDDNKAGV